MKKVICILFAAGVIAGCGQHEKDSAKKADSANLTKDSAQNKYALSVGQELSGVDATFAVKAAAGGMTEVELGKLAKQKGSTKAVKDFGEMMVRDHSAVNDELALLAKNKHIELPKSLDDDGAKLKTELSAKNGLDFDRAYVDAMVKDHEQDTVDFVRAIKVVKYPEITAFAKKTLPILKMHLASAQKIKSGFENK